MDLIGTLAGVLGLSGARQGVTCMTIFQWSYPSRSQRYQV